MRLLALGLALLATSALAQPLPKGNPGQAGFSNEGLARIDKFFEREMANNRVPGAIVHMFAGTERTTANALGEFSLAAARVGTAMIESRASRGALAARISLISSSMLSRPSASASAAESSVVGSRPFEASQPSNMPSVSRSSYQA